ILKVITVPLRKRSVFVDLPIPASYGANVTVSACTVRDKHFAEARETLRLASPARDLNVRVEPDRAEARPGATIGCVVTTTDPKGRPVPADFSLAVVDEAVHALRSDDPRSMRRTFYPFRWWSVATHHSFEIGYLDGEDKSTPGIKPRSKFLDTAFWLPEGRTGADGTARLSVPLPDNLTSWRFTVRAATVADTRVGSARAQVRATKPLAVRLELPRVVGVGDRTRVRALIDNGTGSDQSVAVRLPAAGLFGGGSPVRTVRVPAGRTGSVEWNLAPESPADLVLQCTAWTRDRAYTDGAVSTLTVRPLARQTRWMTAGTLADGRGAFVVPIPSGDIPGERRLVLRISPGIADPLAAAARYLAEYPYGCTEQTLSRALGPVLAAGAVPGTVPDMQVRETGEKALARLARWQHPSGGWGWWEGGADDPFLTAYVLHGLLDLRTAGFWVPGPMVARAVDALRMMAKAGKRVGRYGHWAMARAGRPFGGVGKPGRTLSVRDLASDALRLAESGGNPDPFVAALKRRVRREGPLAWWSDRKPDQWDPDTSDRMDTALVVRALLARDADDALALAGIRWLAASRTGESFGDTRDTAAVVSVLSDWVRRHPGARSAAGRLQVDIGGVDIPLEAGSGERIARVPSRLLRPGENKVRIR
ncbi:MAG: alpha-2-macroglobulin family protein, partial [Armatimonadota bacterium]